MTETPYLAFKVAVVVCGFTPFLNLTMMRSWANPIGSKSIGAIGEFTKRGVTGSVGVGTIGVGVEGVTKHNANVQFGPVFWTYDPSEHCLTSCVHNTGWITGDGMGFMGSMDGGDWEGSSCVGLNEGGIVILGGGGVISDIGAVTPASNCCRKLSTCNLISCSLRL